MDLSIVVPCYNEAKNLRRLIDRFGESLAGRGGVEVVFVDNGSTDGSAEVFEGLLSRPGCAFGRVVTVPANRGYGHGIVAGLRAGRGDFLAWTHADLQTDPADVLAGFDRVVSQAGPAKCFLRGRRVGRGWFDRLFTAGMSAFASCVLRTPLRDINAQPKLFHRSFLDAMADPPDDFSLDLYVLYLARRLGLTVLEQPVEFGKRHAGEAKGGGSLRGKWRLTKRTLRFTLALRSRVSRCQ